PSTTPIYTLSLHDALPISILKTNPNFYAQKISQVVQETETIGEKMNPDYELIRNLIDKDQLNQLSEEKRQIIVENFQAGTDQYQDRKSTRLNSSHVSISYA